MLIVEDGQGRPNANSYGSVEGADTYFNQRRVVDWAGPNASTADKEGLLIQSTEWLDFAYGARYRSAPTYSYQGLKWPRQGIIDPATGYEYPLNWMPKELAIAVYMLARAAVTQPLVNFASDPTRAQLIEKTTGPITKKYNPLTAEQLRASRDFTWLDQVLADYLSNIGINVNVQRG